MNARLIKIWQDLLSSYYFIPALMALGAFVLAFITCHLDRNISTTTIKNLGLFYSNSPDSAHAILATIAGSMITVAGVTFSMTMVAVTSASAQFGPRLIGNFMRDKANQFTLGTYTATFVYCLLIMRIARVGNSETAQNGVTEIVPNISLLVALGMTLTSVGVLIYFIHHIPETLNVGNITARVGRKMRSEIDSLFPRSIGKANEDTANYEERYLLSEADGVSANYEGYIQTLHNTALIKIAQSHNLIIRVQFRPGDFCIKGNILAHFWHLNASPSVDEDTDIVAEIRACFAMGHERTVHQNILFLADELVEILARALSPGVNDPFTAINCMNWFHSSLKAYSVADTPSPYRYDEAGDMRVIAYPVSFDRFLSVICDQSRTYVASDRNTALHMMSILTELAAGCEHPERKMAFKHQLELLYAAAQSQLAGAIDLEDAKAHYQQALKIIADPSLFDREKNAQRWIGGRA
ncbi:DUF2254 domain-containing protein [Hellea sp.]|nr:DUF2254 domain-containing protein [Hellea sp.]